MSETELAIKIGGIGVMMIVIAVLGLKNLAQELDRHNDEDGDDA